MISRSLLLPGLAVILCTTITFHSSLFGQLTTLAVIPLDAKGVSDVEASVLTDRLSLELFRLGKFTVLERGKMEEILNEQNFQMSGCVTEECLVEVGRLLGVEQMAAGSVSKIGNTYTVILRLISAESGAILQVANYDHRGVIDELLSQGMHIVASRLAGMAEPAVAGRDSGVFGRSQQVRRSSVRLFTSENVQHRFAVIPGIYLHHRVRRQGFFSISLRLARAFNLMIPIRPVLTYGHIDLWDRNSRFYCIEASSVIERWNLRLTPLIGSGAYVYNIHSTRDRIVSAGLQAELSEGILSRLMLEMRLLGGYHWKGPVLNLGIGFRF